MRTTNARIFIIFLRKDVYTKDDMARFQSLYKAFCSQTQVLAAKQKRCEALFDTGSVPGQESSSHKKVIYIYILDIISNWRLKNKQISIYI